jgi:hypothetical protein
MKKVLLSLPVLLAVTLPVPAEVRHANNQDKKPGYDPACAYVKKRVEKWDVLVNKRLLDKDNQKLCGQTLKLLRDHLYRISRVVPAKALARLRKIPV